MIWEEEGREAEAEAEGRKIGLLGENVRTVRASRGTSHNRAMRQGRDCGLFRRRFVVDKWASGRDGGVSGVSGEDVLPLCAS